VLENPEKYDFQVSYLEIGWDHEKLESVLADNSTPHGILSYRSLQVYQSCEHTIRWMLENDLINEVSMKETLHRYGVDGPTVIYETGEID